MNTNIEEKRKKENKIGKLKLEKTKLNYTKIILNELKENPKELENITDNLEITEEEFYDNIKNPIDTNITFYDKVLVTMIKKKNR